MCSRRFRALQEGQRLRNSKREADCRGVRDCSRRGHLEIVATIAEHRRRGVDVMTASAWNRALMRGVGIGLAGPRRDAKFLSAYST